MGIDAALIAVTRAAGAAGITCAEARVQAEVLVGHGLGRVATHERLDRLVERGALARCAGGCRSQRMGGSPGDAACATPARFSTFDAGFPGFAWVDSASRWR